MSEAVEQIDIGKCRITVIVKLITRPTVYNLYTHASFLMNFGQGLLNFILFFKARRDLAIETWINNPTV